MKPVLILLFTVLLCATGCSAPPEPGTPTTFAEHCTGENANQRVALTGYLRLPTLMALVTDTVLLDFFESPDGEGVRTDVSVSIGTGANQMEALPDEYRDEDLAVRTHDNQVVGYTDQVVVTGTVNRFASPESDGGFACYLSGPVFIERAPAAREQ